MTNCNEDYTWCIGEIARRGHSVGIHSATHDYNAIYQSKEAYFADFCRMQEIIFEQTGEYAKLVRFPGGSSNTVSHFNPGIMTRLTNDLNDMGYAYFDWNVSAADTASDATRYTVIENFKESVPKHDYSVVLQHDTNAFSVDAVEEILSPAMEDFAIDIIVGKGPSANSIRLDLPRFTLIGATTRAGQLSAPLRDRFGVSFRLELYTPEELCRIITRSAALMGMRIDADGAMELASRSRGTPRIANRMLRRVRDFAQLYYDGVITREAADHALGKLEVDKLGLDATDRRMLTAIIRYYNGGPVGLETLAATIGEEAVTLEDVYEPYLMQIGFLTRTPRGRCVTQLAYDHLHLQNNNAEQLTF